VMLSLSRVAGRRVVRDVARRVTSMLTWNVSELARGRSERHPPCIDAGRLFSASAEGMHVRVAETRTKRHRVHVKPTSPRVNARERVPQTSPHDSPKTRTEHDLLGSLTLPADAFYGIATARAIENFQITSIPLHHFPELIIGLAYVKKASAIANGKLGLLDVKKANAIEKACDELINTKTHHHHFAVDMIQGGAGTSTNMNANEVIANLGNKLLGFEPGSTDDNSINPNDHVNLCQSTNCAYPSAVKLAVIIKHKEVVRSLEALIDSLDSKAIEFTGVIKMGRTQLQDAVPMTLGQEFSSFAHTLRKDLTFMKRNVSELYEMNLGGTAIGTKICAHDGFAESAVSELGKLTELPLESPSDFIEASSSTSSFLLFSNILRRVAVKVSKICNDLRLLASGPRCGFGEIHLPAAAPGSSIMPGKINPVIPEVVNQVCFQVMGTDHVIATASEAAQLQLNVFEPVIAYNLLNNMTLMCNGLDTLRGKCIDGIVADEERCRSLVHNSIGIVTNLLPVLGYKKATAVAKQALETGVPVAEIALKYTDADTVKRALDPKNMIR